MGLQGLADTVLKDLKEILESKSIIGEAIQIGNKTLIPVTKISFGFGIGGSIPESSKKNEFGGGTGGGASVEPVCFLVIDEKGANLIKVDSKKELWEKLLDLPQTEEIIQKISSFFKDKKEDSADKNISND
ncbi:sporulation protein [bacterium]|nr:sporulation protein [bacterium]